MIFIRASDYHLVSDCNRYTICKIVVPKGLLYEAWCGKERITFHGPIDANDIPGREASTKILTAACERHAKRSQTTQGESP